MAAEQRVNENLERDVEDRLASMVRSAKAGAQSATTTRPDWTPREWTVAASKPADFAEATPLDLAKVRTQPRPPGFGRARAKPQSSTMPLFARAAILLFVVALTVAVLAALGIL